MGVVIVGKVKRRDKRDRKLAKPDPGRAAWLPRCQCVFCAGRQRWPGYYTGLVMPHGQPANSIHRLRISYECWIQDEDVVIDAVEIARQSQRYALWCELVGVVLDYRDKLLDKDAAFVRLRIMGIPPRRAALTLEIKFDTLERPSRFQPIVKKPAKPSVVAADAGLTATIKTKFGPNPKRPREHPAMGGACELCGALKVRKHRFCMEHAALALEVERLTGLAVTATLDPSKPEEWRGIRDGLKKGSL